MKLLGLLLFSLLSLIQYPLWIGPGSWFRVWELDSLLSDQQARNAGLRLRNEGLEAELEDLRHGKLAIEERARYSLGMIRDDEIFVQLNPSTAPLPGAPAAARAPDLRRAPPAATPPLVPPRPRAGHDQGHGNAGTSAGQALPVSPRPARAPGAIPPARGVDRAGVVLTVRAARD